ncbi:hypothetical protein LG315_04210 [Microbacterium marinum]|uniref:hypothetical protein n=1 Tax=Microbacterium marinum TaxID=421115 RepID=UPI00384ACC63
MIETLVVLVLGLVLVAAAAVVGPRVELMRESAQAVPKPERPADLPRDQIFRQEKAYRLAVLAEQREALLDARDNSTYDADVLADELAGLDATQIALELRGRSLE